MVQRPPPPETICGYARANIVNTNQREIGRIEITFIHSFQTNKKVEQQKVNSFRYRILVLDDIPHRRHRDCRADRMTNRRAN